MKILHIITRLIVGGAQENTLLTCEGLHRRGHDVTLLTGPSPGPEGALMDRAPCRRIQSNFSPPILSIAHPLHDRAAYNEIRRLVRSTRPDVVHTHSSKAGVLGRAAAWREKRLQPKLLVTHTIHGLPFHPYQNPLARRAWISLERYAARRCDHIITVADAMTRQALAAGIGTNRGKDFFTTIYSAHGN